MAQRKRPGTLSDPDDDSPKGKFNKEGIASALSIFKYILPYKWSFLVGMLLITLSSLVFIFFPWAFGEWLNIAIGKPKYAQYGLNINTMAALLGVVLVVQGFYVLNQFESWYYIY